MTISAKILADSVNLYTGTRITTLELYYPRFIHAEFMTHRVFSRNASSSRAIPVKRLIQAIRKDPAVPIHWGANQKGMQATTELEGWRRTLAKGLWYGGMWAMTTVAQIAAWVGAHKQVVNRLIEPWAHIRVVVTATEWSNFFALRMHPDAQPEIQRLAEVIHEEMSKSKPKIIRFGEWHLPYITEDDKNSTSAQNPEQHVNLLIKVSVARCARTSYRTHEGDLPDLEKDLGLYEKLVGSDPLHASPAEHQATPMLEPALSGNFRDFTQYRKTLPNESM